MPHDFNETAETIFDMVTSMRTEAIENAMAITKDYFTMLSTVPRQQGVHRSMINRTCCVVIRQPILGEIYTYRL